MCPQSPDYSCISKRAKTVEIQSTAYRAMAQWLTWSSMPPDSLVYGEGEWKNSQARQGENAASGASFTWP